MKAILVKYLGPTNSRGSRLKAIEPDGKSVTIPYPHDLNHDEGYRKAAEALMEKMKWNDKNTKLAQGSLKDAEVFVITSEND